MQDALVAPGGIGQTGLGGKTLVPPVDIPAGTFAWFADPEGNTVGLWKSKS
jgi:predicted enzyme related to lactoylglutathione lyase